MLKAQVDDGDPQLIADLKEKLQEWQESSPESYDAAKEDLQREALQLGLKRWESHLWK